VSPAAPADNDVRLAIYRFFRDHGRAPSAAEVAATLTTPERDIEASFRRLHDSHVIVLKPESSDIWMANPWSAVPTPFEVQAAGRSWWGNCVWDSLGVIAMLGSDGSVTTPCPDCGETLSLAVAQRRLQPAQGVVHFAVPAAHWWDDIGYT